MSNGSVYECRNARAQTRSKTQKTNEETRGQLVSICRGAFQSTKSRSSLLLMVALIGFVTLLPTGASADENPQTADVGDLFMEHQVLDYKQGAPRMEGLRSSRKTRCPKKDRNYCMNGGKCRYEIDLKRPICRCQGAWEGMRCDQQEPNFGWTFSKFLQENSYIIIPCVLTGFALVAAITIFCICWRRYRYIKRHKDENDEEVNHNILGKGDSKKEGTIVINLGDERNHSSKLQNL